MTAYSLIIDLVCDDKWSELTYRLWAGEYLNRKNRKYLQRHLKKALLLGNVRTLPRSANVEHLVDAHNLFVDLERTLANEEFNRWNGSSCVRARLDY